VLQVHRADNLTAICVTSLDNVRSSTSYSPIGLHCLSIYSLLMVYLRRQSVAHSKYCEMVISDYGLERLWKDMIIS
jgi:hypothetical protein